MVWVKHITGLFFSIVFTYLIIHHSSCCFLSERDTPASPTAPTTQPESIAPNTNLLDEGSKYEFTEQMCADRKLYMNWKALAAPCKDQIKFGQNLASRTLATDPTKSLYCQRLFVQPVIIALWTSKPSTFQDCPKLLAEMNGEYFCGARQIPLRWSMISWTVIMRQRFCYLSQDAMNCGFICKILCVTATWTRLIIGLRVVRNILSPLMHFVTFTFTDHRYFTDYSLK